MMNCLGSIAGGLGMASDDDDVCSIYPQRWINIWRELILTDSMLRLLPEPVQTSRFRLRRPSNSVWTILQVCESWVGQGKHDVHLLNCWHVVQEIK